MDAEPPFCLPEEDFDELEVSRFARIHPGDPFQIPLGLDPDLLPHLADGAVVVALAGIDMAGGAAVPLQSVGVLEVRAELQVDLAELVPDKDMNGTVEVLPGVDLSTRQGVDDDVVFIDDIERFGRRWRQETAGMRIEAVREIDPLLERELLGAGAGQKTHRSENVSGLLLLELEIVVELLAPLGKAALHDLAIDLGRMGSELPGWAWHETHNRGIDSGTWVKKFRTNGAELCNAPAFLKHQGEDSIVLAARLGDKTIGDFLLHHDDRLIDWARGIEEALQNGVADGIRQVADELHGTFEKERSHVVFGRVGMDDLDAEGPVFLIQKLREPSIRLDEDEAAAFADKVFGEGSEAGPHLDDAVVRTHLELRGDPLRDRGVDEKTLPQLAARGKLVAFQQALEFGEVQT